MSIFGQSNKKRAFAQHLIPQRESRIAISAGPTNQN
jgi:hypothetical protein